MYRAERIPVHSTALLDDAASAIGYPKRDLELALCRQCGFIFNRMFDQALAAYSGRFEESQHFSETFGAFARAFAREIADRCGLKPGRSVLEIGCGKGEFLAELCRVSGCSGTGIDPAFRDDRLGDDRRAGLSFVADTFGPQHYHRLADVVLCRHTLEHIGSVGEFVASIREMIGDRRDVHVVFETPEALRIFSEGAFWDVYYEHAGYLTAGSHARLFRRNKFEIVDLALVYGGQYIVQYAMPATQKGQDQYPIEHDLDRTIALAREFRERAEKQVRQWSEAIAAADASRKRIAIWGGGSKAVAFLTALGISSDRLLVVDKNPFKQGRYLPGSGHRILAPEALRGLPPDLVVAMNPIYQAEIREDLGALGLSPSVVALGC
ncbi:MAG: class I SAM-dependent methyltransferase [Xanthobacteraceae bacterium]